MTEHPVVSDQLHLNLLLNANGGHHSAWRHPDSTWRNALTLDNYVESARIAEAACFDAVFLADRLAFEENPTAFLWSPLEPITTMAAIAASTASIGLITTASTTFSEPYNLARMLSSIDHFSHGRCGWNIVMGYNEDAARNFGLTQLPPRDQRYARAYEFLDAVGALWDSWEDDAIVADKGANIYVDPTKLHPIDHRGQSFSVDGPLNLPRSPQGRPVYIEAGGSADFRKLAGETAEGVYTNLQTIEQGVAFTQEIKQHAVRAGRDPHHVLVMPGVIPYVGSTMAEALARQQGMVELAVPEEALRSLNFMLGTEYADLELDDELDASAVPSSALLSSARGSAVARSIAAGGMTLRALLVRLDGYGHRVIVGTPESIADDFAAWLTTGASDGFTVMPSLLPSHAIDFTVEVVPELQRRGLFRSEYSGTTLRDHYGLPRPAVDRVRIT